MPIDLRRGAFALALALALALGMVISAVPVAAQSVGTAEYHMKAGHEAFEAKNYWMAAVSFRLAAILAPSNAGAHFHLATALAADKQWEEARPFFTRSLELDSGLHGEVQKWLALAPGAPPAKADTRSALADSAPAPPPSAPAPPAGVAFKVGDRVEVRHVNEDWRGGTVLRVAPATCAYYTVRYDPYGNGPADLGFWCGSVRAAANRPAAPALPESHAALSLGTYTCDYKPTFKSPARQMGTITLLEGGVYQYLSNGGSGRYHHDVASGVITWQSGPLRERRPARTTYRRNRNTAQFDILFTGVYEWSCGRNL